MDKFLPRTENDFKSFNNTVRAGKRQYSEKEELVLIKLAQQGNIFARNKVIENNLLFVVSACREYHSKLHDFSDFVNEAIIGMAKAIKKYDFRSNVKFLSFAVWQIRSSLTRIAFDNSLVTTVAVNSRINTIKKKLANGEEIDENDRSLLAAYKDVTSLDNPISSDPSNSLTLADTLSADYHFEDSIEYKDLYNKVMKEVEQLEGTKERIKLYKDIIDELVLGDSTNEALGDKHGLSTERIRIIRKNVVRKLRNKKIMDKFTEN